MLAASTKLTLPSADLIGGSSADVVMATQVSAGAFAPPPAFRGNVTPGFPFPGVPVYEGVPLVPSPPASAALSSQ